MGWVSKILKSTSKWTAEPQTHPNLYRHLSFEMSKAIATLPLD